MALSSQGTKLQKGSASPTVWSDVEEVVSIQGPSSSSNLIDVSHLGSTAKEYLTGLSDSGQLQVTCNFTGGTQQMAMRTMFTTSASAGEFRIRIPTSPGASTYHNFAFRAVVMSWEVGAQVDDKVPLNMTLQVSGSVAYATP